MVSNVDIEYFKNYGLSGLYKELKKVTEDNVKKLKEECESHGGSEHPSEIESITINELDDIWDSSPSKSE